MININLFKSFWDKQPFPARLKSIYETIKADPALRERTEKFRTFQRQEYYGNDDSGAVKR